MTIPTPVVPVESVLQAAQKPVASPAMDSLTQTFEALMKKGPQQFDPTVTPTPSPGPNAITQVMSKQEAVMRKTFDEVQAFTERAGDMSIQEMTAQNMKLTRDLSMANFSLQTTTAVAQGSNKSLQTLLKN